MRETIEFRVPAGHADMFLEPGLGTMLGDSVRKIVLPMDDPRVEYRPVKHKTGKLAEAWRQLAVTSKPVDIVPPTRVGDDPFDLDEPGRHRCPRKHVAGLNRISELWLKRTGHDGSDWVRTRQLIGARQGVLRPQEQLLISPRLYRLLLKLKAKRFEIEVAHWV